MEGRDKVVTERARAVARELGLETVDVEQQAAITGAEWRAWAELPTSRRIIGWIAEGLVVTAEQAEVNSVKRKRMGGLRPDTKNDLARSEVLARTEAELYKRLLRGIAKEANRQD
jgi:hypothetical protein